MAIWDAFILGVRVCFSTASPSVDRRMGKCSYIYNTQYVTLTDYIWRVIEFGSVSAALCTVLHTNSSTAAEIMSCAHVASQQRFSWINGGRWYSELRCTDRPNLCAVETMWVEQDTTVCNTNITLSQIWFHSGTFLYCWVSFLYFQMRVFKIGSLSPFDFWLICKSCFLNDLCLWCCLLCYFCSTITVCINYLGQGVNI